MTELNPNHPVTRLARDQWHKIAALILLKLKLDRVEFTEGEILELMDPLQHEGGFPSIVLEDRNGKLSVYLVDAKTAKELVRKEGGAPV